MSGYIDIHTHLLPGVDDGSKDFDETARILEYAVSRGFAHFVCTPHQIPGAYELKPEQVHAKTAELQNRIKERGIDAHVFPGSEHFMDDVFLETIEQGQPITYRPWTRDVLVETPFMRLPDYFEELTFRMMIKGYRPILAHAERYEDVMKKPKILFDAVEAGYRIQVNLGSFAEFYGPKVRKTAEKLLKLEIVHFAASDIHSADHVEEVYGDGLDRFMKLAGPERARRILIDNPKGLLAAPRKERSA